MQQGSRVDMNERRRAVVPARWHLCALSFMCVGVCVHRNSWALSSVHTVVHACHLSCAQSFVHTGIHACHCLCVLLFVCNAVCARCHSSALLPMHVISSMAKGNVGVEPVAGLRKPHCKTRGI